jgi:glycine cleavage system H protein
VNVPDDRRYTQDHEWARLEDGRVRVGITDFAQDALGDVVFVQLPEVNSELGDAPQRLNEDPYGEGWICLIAPADPAALDALLDADGYRSLTET